MSVSKIYLMPSNLYILIQINNWTLLTFNNFKPYSLSHLPYSTNRYIHLNCI